MVFGALAYAAAMYVAFQTDIVTSDVAGRIGLGLVLTGGVVVMAVAKMLDEVRGEMRDLDGNIEEIERHLACGRHDPELVAEREEGREEAAKRASAKRKDAPRNCPACGLTNPASAWQCDCGQRLPGGA